MKALWDSARSTLVDFEERLMQFSSELAEIKREARQKQQDAAHFNHESLSKDSQAMNSQFLKEKAMKEEEKQSKLAADEILRSYKGGVNENDLKLKEIKEESKTKKQAADEINHAYNGAKHSPNAVKEIESN